MSGGAHRVDAKVVLLGREFSGKTSLVERYLHGRFAADGTYQNTIGAAYGARRVEVDGATVVLGIWDTAGSERYQAMSRIYYRGAWAALLCYELDSAESLAKARQWAGELAEMEPAARVYFVGTKCDLLRPADASDGSGGRAATAGSVAALSRQHGGAAFFETSAKTGGGVRDLFERVAGDFVAQQRADAAAAGGQRYRWLGGGGGGGEPQADTVQVTSGGDNKVQRCHC